MDADVAVVGVGTFGSLVLWQLACRGVDVLGFEQYAPGHDRGAAGGETRLFRLAYAEGAQYTPLLRQARDLWQALAEESGRALFQQCGGLTIGAPDQQQIIDLRGNAAAQDVPVEVLSAGDMAERYPQHRLLDGEIGVLDPAAGTLRSDLAVIAAAQAAVSRGARLLPYCQVQAITPTADGVRVETADRSWRVRQVIVSAGAWSARFLPPEWASAVEARRITLSWFAPDDVAQYRRDRFPILIRVTGGLFLYGVPTIDDATVKIGGTMPGRAIPDPTRFDRRHSHDEVATQRDVISAFFHGLHPDPVRVDAFTDLFTPDQHPLLGRVDAHGRVIAATAGSGRGFKLAPALAAHAADMVTDRIADPISFMSTAREVAK